MEIETERHAGETGRRVRSESGKVHIGFDTGVGFLLNIKERHGQFMLKNQKRSGFVRCMAIAAAILLSFASGITVLAEDMNEDGAFVLRADVGQAPADSEASVCIYIDNVEYSGAAFLKDAVTYVGIREFSLYMGAHTVDWDGAAKAAAITADNLTITAQNGSKYITANGRYLWIRDGIMNLDGTMYVPIRIIAQAFDCSVAWSEEEHTAYLTSGSGAIKPGSDFYSEDELLWLSRIIHAEAQGEPLEGKMAVGSVVLNRVNSNQFPNTIYSVIFDMSAGVQFSPAASGTIYCTPNEESVLAAKLCLEGTRISDNVFFFVNQSTAKNTWVSDNRPFVMTIGNHTFFA